MSSTAQHFDHINSENVIPSNSCFPFKNIKSQIERNNSSYALKDLSNQSSCLAHYSSQSTSSCVNTKKGECTKESGQKSLDYSELMKNYRCRFEIKHGRLSPDGWKMKPSKKDIERCIDYIRQNTQLIEQRNIPSEVHSIDWKDDLFEGYASSAYLHLFEQERIHRLKSDFLKHQPELKAEVRAVLINWIVEKHDQMHMEQETLYIAIAFIDRYLQSNRLLKKDMKMIAAVALFVASKIEEVNPKLGCDVLIVCNLQCSLEYFFQLEINMLQKLNFFVHPPYALQFLRRFSQVSDHMNKSIHTMAKFLLEKSLLSADCASWLPSLLAASCLYVSGRLFLHRQFQWTSSLEFYSGYTENLVRFHAVKIYNLIKCSKSWLLIASKIKFERKEYLSISKCKQLNSIYGQHVSFNL